MNSNMNSNMNSKTNRHENELNADAKIESHSEGEMKWWGWGSPSVRADFSIRTSAIPYLKKHFNFTKDKIEDSFSAQDVLKLLKLP